MTTLEFLGAAGTVTGSKYLLQTKNARVLIDCGLFQGPRALKDLNWQPLPGTTSHVDAVVLTHAHLDHSGYLPKLVKDGFKRKVFCTYGTADLLSLVLPDAGFLQEEEAQHANRKGWSRNRPALPLFTMLEAQRALRQVRPVKYDRAVKVVEGVQAIFHPAGHILGSAIIELQLEEPDGVSTLIFSGDLGREHPPLLRPRVSIPHADYLLIESTYGNRFHGETPAQDLARIIREAAARQGMLLIPSFAIGRTQELLYVLRDLEDQGEIPSLDIFIDSPMAIDATTMTLEHEEEYDATSLDLLRRGIKPLSPRKLHYVRDVQQSRALNTISGPGIIISASGMCSGGRIKHHLKQRLPNERNTVCFVGFQAAETKGRAILEGAMQVWLHGEQVPIRAHVERINGFSAHADQRELLSWLRGFKAPPKQTFVVHGEPEASAALANLIKQELGWNVTVPALNEVFGFVPSASRHEVEIG